MSFTELLSLAASGVGLLTALLTVLFKLRAWQQPETQRLEEKAVAYSRLLDGLSNTRWNVAAAGLQETLARLRHLERLATGSMAFTLSVGLLLLGLAILVTPHRPLLGVSTSLCGAIIVVASVLLSWLGERRLTQPRERIERILATAIDRQLENLQS